MITDFKQKKLVEYLKPNQKVLIRFGHGLGDTLMFLPVMDKLRKGYPKTQIDLYVEAGQEELFGDTMDKEGKGYDLVFSLDYPMSEGSDLTKTEKCCRDEIGIEPPKKEVADLEKQESPFVAVHFQGTALPGSVNCPEETAKKIWQEIKDFGKIPIECHFEHLFHNPENKKFDFINRDVRDCKTDIKSLIGLIQHSFAFVGIASGPLVVALSVMPDRTFYLEKNHKLKNYTKKNIQQNYKEGVIKQWLNTL